MSNKKIIDLAEIVIKQHINSATHATKSAGIEFLGRAIEEHKLEPCEWFRYSNDLGYWFRSVSGCGHLSPTARDVCPICNKRVKVVK